MGCPFKVGDKVWLNDNGFQSLGGPMENRAEALAAVGPLTIKEIGIEVCDGLWDITLCGLLGKYMFTSECFGLIEKNDE